MQQTTTSDKNPNLSPERMAYPELDRKVLAPICRYVYAAKILEVINWSIDLAIRTEVRNLEGSVGERAIARGYEKHNKP